ncbi:hypothetical protein IW140_004698 [Coemansia sp. RSA 1813]|nr:hypothetical protein EV178_004738 [Coemansia sp. RSA 1646]KAJ1766930.1 hypothetical protein LPJ74_005631 [Coemansia sp. RSA 1843]KAJ2087690.1 hypothetical protein IW138_004811 [Coemansia sp. RSA 986]KAJ2212603.1 hypothetical protein EV179_004507 [Coemansia sp. RSA 487]KAJ2567056.1 hypothetical protein IW140_004698 [Coemansia sp. RSA 1813]
MTASKLPSAPLALSIDSTVVHEAISRPVVVNLLAVGSQYSSYLRRLEHNSTEFDDYENHVLPSELAKATLKNSASRDEKLVLDDVTEDMLELDPADWKEQDHYNVLGLSTLRYKAESSQIKQAYQMRALQFHPDKRAATGGTHDDAFFKCAQKAYNLLSDPVRRRQFDSVDPAIPDAIPKGHLEDGQDFFSVYVPIFEREARFSKKQPVPQLGKMDSSREAMEAFYRFWTSFDSWRSFEYLDKEKEHVENREEKRWLDKKNRAERARRKTEDNKRVSTLVQQAMSLDPRIEMYKEQGRREKEKRRLAKEAAARQTEIERKQAEEEKKRQDELKAAQERKRAAEEKREREAKKQELRTMKKSVRVLVANNNYCLDEGQQNAMTVAARSAEIDILLDNMQKEAVTKFHDTLVDNQDNHAQILEAIVSRINEVVWRIPAVGSSFTSFVRGREIAERVRSQLEADASCQPSTKTRSKWSADELELLIKATNKFPGGTGRRWETIGKWLSQHGGFPRRTEHELIAKTNELRSGAQSGGGQIVKNLQSKKVHNDDKRIKNEASVRYDGPQLQQQQQQTKDLSKPDRPWASEEQSQLERALQAYPPAYKGADRWDKIAESVVGRTKKECKLRVKFLIEQVRSKSK